MIKDFISGVNGELIRWEKCLEEFHCGCKFNGRIEDKDELLIGSVAPKKKKIDVLWRLSIPCLRIESGILNYRSIQCLSHQFRCVWSMELIRGMIKDFISDMNGVKMKYSQKDVVGHISLVYQI